MTRNHSHATLGVISFGLALGVTCALATFLLGVMAGLFGWGLFLAQVLQNLFIGFAPTFVGAVTGAVWAFGDGFVAGVLIAFFYNRFLLTRRPHVD